MIDLIAPDWPAPSRVRAAFTTRSGGVSPGRYSTLNLGAHVGDDPRNVGENRRRLAAALGLPAEPGWLTQIHGAGVVPAGVCTAGPVEADASYAAENGEVCAVMTADCLPVLFCDRGGTCVAAAHAGWRGLRAGVLEAAVASIPVAAGDVLAWLGPAIGPDAFEVGEEVRQAFTAGDPACGSAFRAVAGSRWTADLYALAKHRLRRCGVRDIYGGDRCTFSEPEQFFSYRRDGTTGRMAALIWLDGTVQESNLQGKFP